MFYIIHKKNQPGNNYTMQRTPSANYVNTSTISQPVPKQELEMSCTYRTKPALSNGGTRKQKQKQQKQQNQQNQQKQQKRKSRKQSGG